MAIISGSVLLISLLSTLVASAIAGASTAAQVKGAAEANQRTMEYNSAEAAKNRDFQLMMSNTAHQREVADLKAAGLNPIISANAGANTAPVGASSSTTLKNEAPDLSQLASIISSVKDLALIEAISKRYKR